MNKGRDCSPQMTHTMRSRLARLVPALLTASVSLLIAGCTHIGPPSVPRDRFDYNGEIARSWKEQILLNIVKTRYLDVPVFLDVTQIVSGYSLERTVSLGATAVRSDVIDNVSAGVQGVYTDRPTITYTPLTGAEFNRNMLTPIPPAAVLFTMASGWPVDLVFRVAVRSINGIDSGADAPRYDRALVLLRALQQAQVLGMRVQPEMKEGPAVVLFFRARELTPEQTAMLREVRDLLGIEPGQGEFTVVYGQAPTQPGEFAMLTRSMLQILIDLGLYVDVPETDLREGRVAPGMTLATAGTGQLRIMHSRERPADALALVPYRGGWFFVDDRDLESKRTFALTLLFSTLTETGARESLPLVTIPAG